MVEETLWLTVRSENSFFFFYTVGRSFGVAEFNEEVEGTWKDGRGEKGRIKG